EAHAAEAIARIVNRQAILQGERERTAKTLDQARQRRALFAHLDEDFAWSAVLKQADRQISLMSSDDELMREGPPRCGQHSAWIDGKHGLLRIRHSGMIVTSRCRLSQPVYPPSVFNRETLEFAVRANSRAAEARCSRFTFAPVPTSACRHAAIARHERYCET